MGTRDRAVRVSTNDGEVVKEYATVREAAADLGVKASTVIGYIKKGKLRCGCYIEYADVRETKSQLYIRANYNQHRKMNHEPELKEMDDDMSLESCTNLQEEYKRNGITLERISYEMRYGRVGITVCRKKELGGRPMIGTTGCSVCTYFRGRCKEEKFVLCAHRHYHSKEKLELQKKLNKSE